MTDKTSSLLPLQDNLAFVAGAAPISPASVSRWRYWVNKAKTLFPYCEQALQWMHDLVIRTATNLAWSAFTFTAGAAFLYWLALSLTSIPYPVIEAASYQCRNNDGVHTITSRWQDTYFTRCRDGALFEATIHAKIEPPRNGLHLPAQLMPEAKK